MPTHIITNKNFPSLIQGGDDSPHYHATTVEAATMPDLEALLNEQLLAMEAHPSDAIALLDIQHSSAQLKNNVISYSAVLSFVSFGSGGE